MWLSSGFDNFYKFFYQFDILQIVVKYQNYSKTRLFSDVWKPSKYSLGSIYIFGWEINLYKKLLAKIFFWSIKLCQQKRNCQNIFGKKKGWSKKFWSIRFLVKSNIFGQNKKILPKEKNVVTSWGWAVPSSELLC